MESERILAGLKEAMLAEQYGIEFYTVASRNTTDEKGKEVFLMLAAEEGRHLDYLKLLYKDVATEGFARFYDIDTGAALGGDSPIFSDELKHRLADAHWEMTALSVGLQLELSSIDRYRTMARQSEQPELRRFLESLARWEEGHARALERQSRTLREDYWNEAGFAPF
jgi:rubrerythrin